MSELYVPRPYQRIGTQFLLDHQRCMLVADPGLGKTAMTLSAIDLLLIAGSNFFPALVIAPKRVMEVVWTGEQQKWSTFHGLKVVRIMGERSDRSSLLRFPLLADISVINYDLVPWLISQIGSWSNWPFKIVIADESSKLKGFRLNKGGVRATQLSNIAKFTGRWWNLTGTPCSNGLQDLWGQMWFIDYGERLMRTYTDFFGTYFIKNEFTKKISMQHGTEATIHSLVADRMLALRAEDWLDLTQPQVIPIEFELPPDARAHYDRMEKEFFTEMGEQGIEAPTAQAKSQKLLEIAAGSVYDEFQVAHPVHDARIEALEDIVEAAGPLLVSYWWKFDVPRIKKAFPQAVLYAGQREQDLWNEGKIPLMLIHQQSSYGVNLHLGGRDLAFYSYVWNAEHRQQMIERIGPTRQAQAGFKRVVRIWDITARDTIDQGVLDSNAGKISVEQALKRARARRRTV
jgi:SNF2 family DNA or RNA helicase